MICCSLRSCVRSFGCRFEKWPSVHRQTSCSPAVDVIFLFSYYRPWRCACYSRTYCISSIAEMPDIAQSLPICILLSALGGAVEVAATAVLAYREADERRTGTEWRKLAQSLALGCNVALQLVSSIVGNLFATWYGPISIVGPIFLSSQLLANMLVFGWLLGLESFNKDMRIGTYVVVTAVVLLPIVGPTAQDRM